MPDYGKANYWDARYSSDSGLSAPFDWLFDFHELHACIATLLPDKATPLFCVGAGNAPFSPDLHSIGGYLNITNTDLSAVAMDAQRALYPMQQWVVMDVLDMSPVPDSSIPVVLDKSLIDTLMCYNDSVAKVRACAASRLQLTDAPLPHTLTPRPPMPTTPHPPPSHPPSRLDNAHGTRATPRAGPRLALHNLLAALSRGGAGLLERPVDHGGGRGADRDANTR